MAACVLLVMIPVTTGMRAADLLDGDGRDRAGLVRAYRVPLAGTSANGKAVYVCAEHIADIVAMERFVDLPL